MWSSFTATIAINASLSDLIAVPRGMEIVGIQMPSAWTAAGLTFTAAQEASGTFAPVYDASGNEVSFAASTSRVIAVNPLADGIPFGFLKIQSGTTATPVTQTAARSLIVFFRKI